jgi:hydroxymethylpyrimidine/phosphomethylpyrimidine kinase
LFPRAEILTPNGHEASRLLTSPIEDPARAARELQSRFRPRVVAIKGGHAPDHPDEVSDYVFDGKITHMLSAQRIGGVEVRGTGCMLASAIAAQRAQNVEPLEAVKHAKRWITEQIKNAEAIGKGRRIATYLSIASEQK